MATRRRSLSTSRKSSPRFSAGTSGSLQGDITLSALLTSNGEVADGQAAIALVQLKIQACSDQICLRPEDVILEVPTAVTMANIDRCSQVVHSKFERKLIRQGIYRKMDRCVRALPIITMRSVDDKLWCGCSFGLFLKTETLAG